MPKKIIVRWQKIMSSIFWKWSLKNTEHWIIDRIYRLEITMNAESPSLFMEKYPKEFYKYNKLRTAILFLTSAQLLYVR